MKTTIDDLMTRRSIRAFKPAQIDPDTLKTVLEVGTYAPSARGAQSAIMVVVQDEPTLVTLNRMNAAVLGKPDANPMFDAPTAVVVLADRQNPDSKCDASLVMGNLMHAAHALNLGSCWINRAREMFSTDEGRELLAKWGVKGDYEGVGICIMGYPDEAGRPPKPRKENYIYWA